MEIRVGNPQIGDLAKDVDLPATTGTQLKFADVVGKPVVLVFFPSEKVAACEATLKALRDAHDHFKSRGVQVWGVSFSAMEGLKAFAESNQLPFPLLADPQLKVYPAYGALRPKQSQEAAKLQMDALRRTILLGPELRVQQIYDNPDPTSHAEQLIKDIDALILRESPRRVIQQAPVLLIQNVLPAELCRRLMEVWKEQGNEDSGFMKQVEGKTVGMYDYSHKIRRDHFMKDGPELAQVKNFIANRVIPPIRAAFNYEVSRFEDFRIACYDASRGGFFRPHRDNTTDGTAHRRFAMSLLLNDDYEGGTLRFPEYGRHEYRPDAGSAVIFSCSLLHEATDVTAGLRFVLLSFFYGEREAKIREDYNQRTGGQYRA